MGKNYIIEYLGKTIPCVDEFEKKDEHGHRIYSRMIIKHYWHLPGEYYNGIALIVRRRKYFKQYYVGSTTFSKLAKGSTDFNNYLKDVLTYEVCNILKTEREYYFEEENMFCFFAQGSKDRSGFYKEWCNNQLMAEKNYGDCSYSYEIIGLRYYQLRF